MPTGAPLIWPGCAHVTFGYSYIVGVIPAPLIAVIYYGSDHHYHRGWFPVVDFAVYITDILFPVRSFTIYVAVRFVYILQFTTASYPHTLPPVWLICYIYTFTRYLRFITLLVPTCYTQRWNNVSGLPRCGGPIYVVVLPDSRLPVDSRFPCPHTYVAADVMYGWLVRSGYADCGRYGCYDLLQRFHTFVTVTGYVAVTLPQIAPFVTVTLVPDYRIRTASCTLQHPSSDSNSSTDATHMVGRLPAAATTAYSPCSLP